MFSLFLCANIYIYIYIQFLLQTVRTYVGNKYLIHNSTHLPSVGKLHLWESKKIQKIPLLDFN